MVSLMRSRIDGKPDVCAHCLRSNVQVSVILPADLSHTGKSRRKIVGVDACLAEIVRRLNSPVFGEDPITEGCCCGHGNAHGEILLVDGRRLEVHGGWLPDREEGEPCTNCGNLDCEPGTPD